jgi:hypothetical protein
MSIADSQASGRRRTTKTPRNTTILLIKHGEWGVIYQCQVSKITSGSRRPGVDIGGHLSSLRSSQSRSLRCGSAINPQASGLPHKTTLLELI